MTKSQQTALGRASYKEACRSPFKSDFVDGKRSRGCPKNSWKEAVDKNSIGRW